MLELVRSVLRKLGIEVFRSGTGYHWVPDYFGNRFHKQQDLRTFPVFGKLATKVIDDERTCLHYCRLYAVFCAVQNVIRKFGDNGLLLAEIGVYKGGGSYFIASLLQELGVRNWQLHSFDTFTGFDHENDTVGGLDGGHAEAERKGFTDTSYESVKEYLSCFENVAVHKGKFEDNCGLLENGTVHFAHLDVDVYLPTVHALDFLDKRLAVGGIIVVDDYNIETCKGNTKAVDEFVASHLNYTSIPIIAGSCVLVKAEP